MSPLLSFSFWFIFVYFVLLLTLLIFVFHDTYFYYMARVVLFFSGQMFLHQAEGVLSPHLFLSNQLLLVNEISHVSF
jgi:hypothetical protein